MVAKWRNMGANRITLTTDMCDDYRATVRSVVWNEFSFQ